MQDIEVRYVDMVFDVKKLSTTDTSSLYFEIKKLKPKVGCFMSEDSAAGLIKLKNVRSFYSWRLLKDLKEQFEDLSFEIDKDRIIVSNK